MNSLIQNNSAGFAARAIINNNLLKKGIKNFSVVGDGIWNDTSNLLAALEDSVSSGYAIAITAGINISLGGQSLSIPAGAKLIFDGGIISNGTLIGNNTTIEAPTIKIFNLDLTLQGTFNMEYICPQHYGAIPNASRSSFINDCSAEIQKCLDSPLNVFFPNGFYYVSSGLEINKSKKVMMNNRSVMGDNIEKVAYTLEMNHGRIYTDQDINLVTIRSQGVDLLGAFDTTNVSDFTKAVIVYDCNFKIWGGNLDVYLYGNVNGIVGLGRGGTGIRFNQDDATTQHGNAVYINVSGYIQWYHTGIKIDSTNAFACYVNSLNVDVNMNGCKRFIHAGDGSMSMYKGIFQTRPILVAGEEDTYCVTIGGSLSYVNCFLWDMDQSYNASYGGVSNTRGFLLEGLSIEMGHWTNSFYGINKVQGSSQVVTPSVINPQSSIISKNMLVGGATVISKLDSETIALDKRHTVTLKKFSGLGKNFETDLDETVGPETDFVTIASQSGLWRVTGPPTNVVFNSGGNLDVDYVELVLTPSSGTFEWACFYFYFQYFNCRFKKVQVIEHLTNTTKTSTIQDVIGNRGVKNTMIFNLGLSLSDKTIIRFIGATQADTILQILDVAATRRTPTISPYVHIDGGQTIYGILTTGQYKLSDLNTAPSSASASGTKGDIRVTATHIYVCIATNTWVRTALSSW